MAVLYATGWEAGTIAYYQENAKAWSERGNGAISSNTAFLHRTTTGIGGNYSMYIDDGFGMLPFLPGTSARWAHLWMKYASPAGGDLHVQVQLNWLNSTQQFGVYIQGTGTISFYRGNTLVQNNAGAFNAAVPHWVAIEFNCQDVGGQVAVWMDGVNVATFTGDTQNHASPGWNQLGFANAYGGGWFNNNTYVDDIIVTDSTTGRLEEQVCAPLAPNADTAQKDFTPSSGILNYAMVSEVPASDANYNSATAVGQEDRYDFTDLPAGVNTVTFASFTGRAARDGSITKGEVSVKSGAAPTVYATAVQLPAAGSYMGDQLILENDPNTAAPWSTAAINAVQAGYRFNS